MKSGKAGFFIIIIISVFFAVAIIAQTVNSLLTAAGVNSKPVVVFVAFAIIVTVVKKLNRELKKNRNEIRKALLERQENSGTEMRHIDFMTNRSSIPVRNDCPASATAAKTLPDEKDEVINGVVWRWQPGRRGPEIIGAFCSKCARELVAVKTHVSWEADLRCGGCGKTFVSLVQEDPNAKPRSFSQTKKMAARIINDRHGAKY